MRADGRLAERGGLIELLRVPAALFGGIARLRGALYSRGVLPSHEAGVPTISVGNLSVGGTGKTPMIAWLAQELQARGHTPGIVSRGYRAATDGGLNDEAVMLGDLLPGVPHIQNRDRVSACRELVEAGVSAILVDDGFQHRRLARQLDIVLIDALRPFGLPAPKNTTGRGNTKPVRAFLPRGLMREPVSALRRAGLCVLTRTKFADPSVVRELTVTVARAAPQIPIVESDHAPVALRRIDGPNGESTTLPLEDLAGLEVDLLSGIGNPGAFEASCSSLGARVRSHRALPDHHAFTADDFADLGSDAPVLTTAKDAARMRTLDGVPRPERLYVLDVRLVITTGRESVDAALDAVLGSGPQAVPSEAARPGRVAP